MALLMGLMGLTGSADRAAGMNTAAAVSPPNVIINAHTPAFVENQLPRIDETSNFMLLLRRLLDGTEPGSPSGEFAIFITGDLNGNSPKLELSIARTGKFSDPGLGPMNFWPDDYQLPLTDAAPRHTHSPRIFTWKP